MADNNAGLALAVLGLSKSGGGGTGPSEYIKSAKVEDEGNRLTLTNKNDEEEVFESYYIFEHPRVNPDWYRDNVDYVKDALDDSKPIVIFTVDEGPTGTERTSILVNKKSKIEAFDEEEYSFSYIDPTTGNIDKCTLTEDGVEVGQTTIITTDNYEWTLPDGNEETY